jgi:hypothetical protein
LALPDQYERIAMAKKENAGVTVRLSCVLSGHPDSPGPGSIVTLDADEAKRLIDLGVAEVAAPAADE